MADSNFCRYRKGYKYQLANHYEIQTPIIPEEDIETEFICLFDDGLLFINSGYAWDGPSGPVVDRDENLRGSLVHDALYQLMRKKYLSARKWRKAADELFRDLCIEDGIPAAVAVGYYAALRAFGIRAADPVSTRQIHRAPKGSN